MTETQSPQQNSTGMLSGKVALVTGGTRGIGAAVGRGLAEEGASIAAGYWRGHEGAEKFLAAMSAEYPKLRCTVHEGNIGQADDCRRVVREVIDQHGHLDILVTTLGSPSTAPSPRCRTRTGCESSPSTCPGRSSWPRRHLTT